MTDHDTAEPVAARGARWPWIVIAGALTIIAVVVHSPLLSVDTVRIEGVTRSAAEARVADTGVGAGALLLYVDTGEIEDAVRADPWVVDVAVSRIWPDAVVVEVLEHDPLMWIEGVSTWMLVARDGTVLELADEPTPGLLRAAVAFPDREPGEDPIDPSWTELVELALVLADDIGGTLELELRGPELWTVALGHEVRIGHPIDLADKGRTMRAVLASEPPDGSIIDVSSPIRPAVIPPEAQVVVEGADEGT